MVFFRTIGGWKSRKAARGHFLTRKNSSTSTSLANDLNGFKNSPSDESKSKSNPTKHVVIVMDGLEEFTTESLQWALANLITGPGSVVTLLGVMPWLNIPLSSKTWLDVWSVELEEVISLASERSEWIKSGFKYMKLKQVIDLCNSYGVVLKKKVLMGYPSRLLVVEQITSLNATWVVFDRHQRNTKYYAKKIPSKMVVMNQDGEADMIKGRPLISGIPGESPATPLPTPKLIVSDQFKGILKERSRSFYDVEDDHDKDVCLQV